jgi:hypothetical protein
MSTVRARRRRRRPHTRQGRSAPTLGDTHFEATPPRSVSRTSEATRGRGGHCISSMTLSPSNRSYLRTLRVTTTVLGSQP